MGNVPTNREPTQSLPPVLCQSKAWVTERYKTFEMHSRCCGLTSPFLLAGQFGVVSTAIVVCYLDEGLYLYAVSSVCPMSLDDTRSFRYVSPTEDACSRQPGLFPCFCSMGKADNSNGSEKTPSECRMPGQMLKSLSQHLFLRWNAARHGVKLCSLIWARHRGSPGAGKPHAGKYRELTLLRQRGGGGSGLPLTHCVS